MCGKYLENGKDIFGSFMDLEKDNIYRHGMWQMLRVYRIGGKLLKTVQNFYVDNTCVMVGIDVSELFMVNVQLRQQGRVDFSFFDCLSFIFC